MLGSPTITVKGRNLLAKIVADNIPLTLSNIGLGDGLQEENEEVTILANEIMKKEIESCKYSEKEGQYYIRRVFTNADLEEGFYIREVGIYAIDPDEGEILYAYTNAGENGVDYFAPGKGKVIVKEIIEMATKFGNAENITIVIDPSIALVSEKEFEEYKNSNKVNTDNLQKQVTKNTTDLNAKANKNNAEFTGTMILNTKDIATYEKFKPTFLNGWQNATDNVWQPLTFYKIGNICFIVGILESSSLLTEGKQSPICINTKFLPKNHFISIVKVDNEWHDFIYDQTGNMYVTGQIPANKRVHFSFCIGEVN